MLSQATLSAKYAPSCVTVDILDNGASGSQATGFHRTMTKYLAELTVVKGHAIPWTKGKMQRQNRMEEGWFCQGSLSGVLRCPRKSWKWWGNTHHQRHPLTSQHQASIGCWSRGCLLEHSHKQCSQKWLWKFCSGVEYYSRMGFQHHKTKSNIKESRCSAQTHVCLLSIF